MKDWSDSEEQIWIMEMVKQTRSIEGNMVTGEFCPYPGHDDYENELRNKRRLPTYVNELGLFIWSQRVY